MSEAEQGLLEQLAIGPARRAGRCTFFPLIAKLDTGPRVETLPAVLASGEARVRELPGVGEIARVVITNSRPVPLLALSGMELVGGKQNRVVTAACLVPPHAETHLSVTCAEAGRWQYGPPTLDDSGFIAALDVRKVLLHTASATGRAGLMVADQRAVWRAISAQLRAQVTVSPTDALFDAHVSAQARHARQASRIDPLQSQVGIVAVAAGAVLGADLCSCPQAYAGLHDRLVLSYLAAEPSRAPVPVACDALAAERFLSMVHESIEALDLGAAGASDGRSARVRSPSAVGEVLTLGGDFVCASYVAFGDAAAESCCEEGVSFGLNTSDSESESVHSRLEGLTGG